MDAIDVCFGSEADLTLLAFHIDQLVSKPFFKGVLVNGVRRMAPFIPPPVDHEYPVLGGSNQSRVAVPRLGRLETLASRAI